MMDIETEQTDRRSDGATTDRAPAAQGSARPRSASRPRKRRTKAVTAVSSGKQNRGAAQAQRSTKATFTGPASLESSVNDGPHNSPRRHEPVTTGDDPGPAHAPAPASFRPRWDGDTLEAALSTQSQVPASDPSSRETTEPRRRALNDPVVVKALNQQAGVLENVFFPLQVIKTLGIEEKASVLSARIFLGRFRQQAGASGDAIEKLLLDELCLAHLKSGELHALAAASTNLEFKQLYLSAQSRLVGAICQLVSTLNNHRTAQRRNTPRRNKPDATRHQQAAKRGTGRVPKRDRKPKEPENEQGR